MVALGLLDPRFLRSQNISSQASEFAFETGSPAANQKSFNLQRARMFNFGPRDKSQSFDITTLVNKMPV